MAQKLSKTGRVSMAGTTRMEKNKARRERILNPHGLQIGQRIYVHLIDGKKLFYVAHIIRVQYYENWAVVYVQFKNPSLHRKFGTLHIGTGQFPKKWTLFAKGGRGHLAQLFLSITAANMEIKRQRLVKKIDELMAGPKAKWWRETMINTHLQQMYGYLAYFKKEFAGYRKAR